MLYEVVAERDMGRFQDEVTRKLEDGWKLHGSLATESAAVTIEDKTQVTLLFMQAITKEA